MTVDNPFIEGGNSKVFFYSESNRLTFYGVQSEKIVKTAGQLEMPIPTLDSSMKIVMDVFGASKEITVTGIVTSELLGEGFIFQYAQDIAGLGNNSLIFGFQDDIDYGNYFYTSEIMNRGYFGEGHLSMGVVVVDATIERKEFEPETLYYTVVMLEHEYNSGGGE